MEYKSPAYHVISVPVDKIKSNTYNPTLVGDSALKVTIASNYTVSEGDGLYHLGSYKWVGPNSPQPGRVRYRPYDAAKDGPVAPETGFVVDNTITNRRYNGEYVFDYDDKRVVSAGELTLVEGKTYFLDSNI